jgi:hypothetical protein
VRNKGFQDFAKVWELCGAKIDEMIAIHMKFSAVRQSVYNFIIRSFE